ncbi:MAG: acyl-CoA thioesterase [Oligoflexia bacterium]|nr:acyl-CoA thioesterase [Oligoflexia bacterium]
MNKILSSTPANLRLTKTAHLVKYSDLNHHGTLFAGKMSEWLVETSFIAAARFLGRPEDIVCIQVHGIKFTKPARRGDLVEIQTQVGHVGKKSITVIAKAYLNTNVEVVIDCSATFVSVDQNGHSYEHGLKLPQDYIDSHSDICEKAERIYNKK